MVSVMIFVLYFLFRGLPIWMLLAHLPFCRKKPSSRIDARTSSALMPPRCPSRPQHAVDTLCHNPLRVLFLVRHNTMTSVNMRNAGLISAVPMLMTSCSHSAPTVKLVASACGAVKNGTKDTNVLQHFNFMHYKKFGRCARTYSRMMLSQNMTQLQFLTKPFCYFQLILPLIQPSYSTVFWQDSGP
jgi:hypothetical protein